MIFKGLLQCTPAAPNEHAKYIKKIIKILNKNPRKMDQKHHQKINNLYFIYKSPRAMLLTAKNTRNDAQGPLQPENPPKFRRFSHQSATVGLSIVNHACRAHDRTLHLWRRRRANFKVMVLED